MDEGFHRFRRTLISHQIIGYSTDDLEYLYNVAKICAVQGGIPVAGAGAVLGAGAGTIALPVLGSVPGWVAGALAGFVGGTAVCVMGRGAIKGELDKLLAHR